MWLKAHGIRPRPKYRGHFSSLILSFLCVCARACLCVCACVRAKPCFSCGLFCFIFLSISIDRSPWYNRNGRLGVKHQVSYLLSTGLVPVGWMSPLNGVAAWATHTVVRPVIVGRGWTVRRHSPNRMICCAAVNTGLQLTNHCTLPPTSGARARRVRCRRTADGGGIKWESLPDCSGKKNLLAPSFLSVFLVSSRIWFSFRCASPCLCWVFEI